MMLPDENAFEIETTGILSIDLRDLTAVNQSVVAEKCPTIPTVIAEYLLLRWAFAGWGKTHGEFDALTSATTSSRLDNFLYASNTAEERAGYEIADSHVQPVCRSGRKPTDQNK